jgi:plasmid stabilization system protein ParE
MQRGSKLAYTDKQKRQAEHIEDSYKARGVAGDEAAALAWATVNKASGGGRKSGSGRAVAKRGGKRKTAS